MADYTSGKDASYVKPFLIPDEELRPRDNSGGIDWDPYTQQWDDGGYVTGSKSHLSASGGEDRESINAERGAGRRGSREDASYGAPHESTSMPKEYANKRSTSKNGREEV